MFPFAPFELLQKQPLLFVQVLLLDDSLLISAVSFICFFRAFGGPYCSPSWLSCCAALQHSFCNSLSCSRGNITLAQRPHRKHDFGPSSFASSSPLFCQEPTRIRPAFSGGRSRTPSVSRWPTPYPLEIPSFSRLPQLLSPCVALPRCASFRLYGDLLSPFSESYDHSVCPFTVSLLPAEIGAPRNISLDLDLPHRGYAKSFRSQSVSLRIKPRDAPVSSSVRRHKTPSEPDQRYRVHSNGLQGVLSGRGHGP